MPKLRMLCFVVINDVLFNLFCVWISFFVVVISLSSYTRRRRFLSEALVYYCVLVFRRIGEDISLHLF